MKVCRDVKEYNCYVITTPIVVVNAMQGLVGVSNEMHEECECFLAKFLQITSVSDYLSIVSNGGDDAVTVWAISARDVSGSREGDVNIMPATRLRAYFAPVIDVVCNTG